MRSNFFCRHEGFASRVRTRNHPFWTLVQLVDFDLLRVAGKATLQTALPDDKPITGDDRHDFFAVQNRTFSIVQPTFRRDENGVASFSRAFDFTMSALHFHVALQMSAFHFDVASIVFADYLDVETTFTM